MLQKVEAVEHLRQHPVDDVPGHGLANHASNMVRLESFSVVPLQFDALHHRQFSDSRPPPNMTLVIDDGVPARRPNAADHTWHDVMHHVV